MSAQHQRKRSAAEPVETLLVHDDAAAVPAKRPNSLTLGGIFVFARAIAGLLWLGAFALLWGEIRAEAKVDAASAPLVFWIVVASASAGILVLLALGWLILKGNNVARVLVMLGLTFSIITAATGYFVNGEQITIQTTLLLVALDILVLLALSSREARAWSRKK